MKKITTSIIALLLTMGFMACNSNGKTGPAGGTGTSSDAVTLELRLKAGDKFGYTSNMDMDISTGGMGLKMKTNMKSVFDVISAGSQGKELKLGFSEVKMATNFAALSTPMMDSAMKKAADAIMARSVNIVLSPDNKIVEVKNVDSAFVAATDGQTKLLLNSLYSRQQMNTAYGMIFSLYPNKPVKPGDSWETENDIALSAVQMKVKSKYTLTSVKDGIATIGIAGTVDGKAIMSRGTTIREMPVTGTQKGTMNVKLADGYLEGGTTSMDVNTQIETNGKTMPMTITMNTTYTGN